MSFFLHVDYIAAFRLSFAIANHIEKLIECLVSFLVTRNGTKKDSFAWYVPQRIDIDHLAPDIFLNKSRVHVVTLLGRRGGVFSFTAIHNETGRIFENNIIHDMTWQIGAVAKPSDNVQFLWFVFGISWPIPILVISNLGTDIATGRSTGGDNLAGITAIFPGIGRLYATAIAMSSVQSSLVIVVPSFFSR